MEFVHILKSLWSRRILMSLGFVAALLAALLLSGRLNLFPPGSDDPTVRIGAASAEILIDAPDSTLGDLRRDTLPLVARSGIFARFLGADGATDAISRESGIPKKDISVVGPKLSIDGVPDQAAAERASRLRGKSSHLLQVQRGDDLPLLVVFTQAPTEKDARKLANGTATALTDYILKYQDEAGIADKRRVTIRQLGTARSAELVETPSPVLPILAFIFVFGAFCFGVLAWPGIVATWRSRAPWHHARPGANGDAPGDDGSLADEGMYELWPPAGDAWRSNPPDSEAVTTADLELADEGSSASKAQTPFGS